MTHTIAVIGGGFTGTMLALHLHRRCPPGTRTILIERDRFGGGPAYSTDNPNHLLNVPAGGMSALPGQPDDFLQWFNAQGAIAAATSQDFVSRRRYGDYIRHRLHDALAETADPGRLVLRNGDVADLHVTPGRVTLSLGAGDVLETDHVVLAVGNFPPEPLPIVNTRFYDGGLYRGDPWAPDTLAGLAPDAPVLMVGTGLTMVDVLISLLDAGHRGPVHALSRHGLLPLSHGGQPHGSRVAAYPANLVALMRAVRADASAGEQAGLGWQGAIDQLRPFTTDLWRAMPDGDRRRFLRHLRRWWDIHRHRIAPQIAARVEDARASGRLRVHAGRLRDLRERDGMADAEFIPQGATKPDVLRVARVINCAGPNADYARIRHPLVRNLLAAGTVRPDRLHLGLDVADSCALIDREGAVSRRLFAAGPVTRGLFWEIVAVPDIRRQCERLAINLAAMVRAAA